MSQTSFPFWGEEGMWATFRVQFKLQRVNKVYQKDAWVYSLNCGSEQGAKPSVFLYLPCNECCPRIIAKSFDSTTSWKRPLGEVIHPLLYIGIGFLCLSLSRCKNIRLIKGYLAESITTKSAILPISMEPCVADRPKEWAALMVEAANASLRLILWLTQAKCITAGLRKKSQTKL